MKRTRFIIALPLMAYAAEADSQIVSAAAHVISLAFVKGDIEERREQKPFDTYALCLAWKHQREFLPPDPPAFISFVYCAETEAALKSS